jgi:hypothetical protein
MPSLTPAQRDYAQGAWLAGQTLKQLGQYLGCSHTTIRRAVLPLHGVKKTVHYLILSRLRKIETRLTQIEADRAKCTIQPKQRRRRRVNGILVPAGEAAGQAPAVLPVITPIEHIAQDAPRQSDCPIPGQQDTSNV